MRFAEVRRILLDHGFTEDARSKHVVFSKGDQRVTVSRGTRMPEWALRSLRSKLRKV